MLDKLFLSVLNMSITASLVILVVLLVRLLLKKAPKIFSYALWAVVLFRLICPFSFESTIGLLPINKTPIPQDIVYSSEPQINTGLNIVDNVVNPMLPIPNNTQDSVNSLQIWVFVGSVIWASGILAMLIYSIIQFVRLKQKLIGATPLRNNIYLADHISSPFVMGFIKPKIYLPSFIAEAEQSFIIAHEKYHIKRFDHVTRILGFVALTIHWFNPLVWLAFILSGKDMEMSCDEVVMKKMNTDIRAEYSKSLLRFATDRKFNTATPLAFGEGDTKDRVKNVMRYKKPIFGAVLVLTVLVVGLIAILSTNAKQKPTDLDNSIVSIQVNDSVFNPRFYANDFNFNYDELPVLVLSKNNQIMPLFLTKEFKKTAYLGFDAYTDGAVVRDTYELSVNDSGTAYLYIGDETQQNIPYLHNKHDYIICYLKSDLHEKAEYVFKIEFDEILYNSNTNTLTDFQSIEIGTEKNKIHEQFGEPNNTLPGIHGDIYIVEDKQIAIYYGFGSEDSYPVTEVKISDYIPKTFTHDQAVVSALTSLGKGHFSGECFAEGHIILGYDDSDVNKTRIYTLVTMSGYGFENNNFVQVSGTAFPAVITLNRDNSVSIEQPLDGSDYAVSIEKMFPEEYHKRIFDYANSDRQSIKQQEEKYAKEYLSKIERDAKVGAYSDFEYISLTDVGVSVDVSNNLQDFYKQHSNYPSFIGTSELIENGIRVVYETNYEKNSDEIKFIKYNYNTKEIIEQFTANAKTGEIFA